MTDLPEDLRVWIEDVTGAGLRTTTELDNANTASVYRLDLADGRGLVAKRFDRQDFLDERSDRAEHEAAVMKILETTPVPAPELVAVDGDGVASGAPTVLMSWIEGASGFPDGWIEAVAADLADIHRVDPGDITWPYERYNANSDLVVPSWASDPGLWEDAFAIATDPPATAHGFIHRDYHGGNLLWREGKLAGVLDWLSGCVGPVAIDLAHLRLNLAMDHGMDAADAVLAEYRKHGRAEAWHPAWAVVDAIDFLPFWHGPQAVEAWRWDDRPIVETQERFDHILTDAAGRL